MPSSLSSSHSRTHPRNPSTSLMTARIVAGGDTNYTYINSLGGGGGGQVYKVRRRADGHIMACKSIACNGHPSAYHEAYREIATWAALAGKKNVARFSGDWSWDEVNQTVRLYMTFYESGDLQNLLDGLRYERVLIHPLISMNLAYGVMIGLKACHGRRILHRDLKPPNVLLKYPVNISDALWTIQYGESLSTDQRRRLTETYESFKPGEEFRDVALLSDFGFGKVVRTLTGSVATFDLGTPGYIPPEVVGPSGVFSNKSDIFSLGCMLYDIFSGRSLYTIRGPLSSVELPDYYPPELTDLLRKCIDIDPHPRPTIIEAMIELCRIYEEYYEDNFRELQEYISQELLLR